MGRRKAEPVAPRIGQATIAGERERQDMLRYISEMTGELAYMAGAARMPMLTYFLNMARVEAEMQLHQATPGPWQTDD